MSLADFIHLRVHSPYSLSAGAIKIKELVGLCRGEAMPAVAVTDNGNLFGALEFATACAEAGIQPIIGCEIALLANGGARNGRSSNGNGHGHAAEPDRIVLLVQSEAAEAALLALKDIFPERLYIELQRHGSPEEARCETGLVDLAYVHDLPLVATNDAY